jgi:hypothetical protein
MQDDVSFPADPASQRRAAHFAALRVLAEAASEDLRTAREEAAALARDGAGFAHLEGLFSDFLALTRAADEAVSAALGYHQEAWNAFLDAVLCEDEG